MAVKLHMLRGFAEFHCAGGACPDTCCRDWAIALDEPSAERYRSWKGPLGDDLRGAMGELDGEPCLQLRGGLCPMLDGSGLCRVQAELGEEGLCASCRMHPRFAEEYGALQEWCLSLACPEAVRLLLADPSPLTFSESVNGEPVPGANDLDARLFYTLLSARKTAFAIVQDRSVPWQLRTAQLLAFAESSQRALDGRRIGRLAEISARYSEKPLRRRPLPGPAALLERLRTLAPINDRWPAILCTDCLPTPEDRAAVDALVPPHEPEHLLYYFLYRYFLKAAADRQLLPRVRLAVYGVLGVRALETVRYCKTGSLTEADRIDLIHRFSREVEHSPENREAVSAWGFFGG